MMIEPRIKWKENNKLKRQSMCANKCVCLILMTTTKRDERKEKFRFFKNYALTEFVAVCLAGYCCLA
jgi:hypothetical protein